MPKITLDNKTFSGHLIIDQQYFPFDNSVKGTTSKVKQSNVLFYVLTISNATAAFGNTVTFGTNPTDPQDKNYGTLGTFYVNGDTFSGSWNEGAEAYYKGLFGSWVTGGWIYAVGIEG